MILCWRLPNRAKWVALVVEVSILLVGVLLFSCQEVQKTAGLPLACLDQLRGSPGDQRVQENLDLAPRDLDNLLNRTTSIPGDFTTGDRDLENAKERARQRIGDLTDQLQELETKATIPDPLRLIFDVLGGCTYYKPMNSRLIHRNEHLFRPILVLALFSVTILVVGFSSFLLAQTTDLILFNDGARAFLEKIRSVPLETWKIPTFSGVLLGIMVAGTLFRARLPQKYTVQLVFSALDIAISVGIIVLLDFSYRGILFIAIVNAMRFFESKLLRLGLATFCIVIYMMMDYDLVSLRFPVFSINDYLDYYRDSIRLWYYGTRNLLSSFNEILFIGYMVLEIQTWIEENTEIRELNRRLLNTTEELRLTNVRLEEYASRSENSARIRERDRLAREIHDIVAHSLTGIEVGLKACLDAFQTDPNRVKLQLGKILLLAKSGVDDMRRSVSDLRTSMDSPTGFRNVLSQLIERIGSITGTEILFMIDGDPRDLPPLAEEALYRTVQEGLTNSLRHGQASKVEVELRYNEATVELSVRDNGIGTLAPTRGNGLTGMHERAEALGGQLFVTNLEKGFLVQVSLPLSDKPGAQT